MAESLKVVKITIEELMKRMDKMEIGEVIGLANYEDESCDEGGGWFGIKKIDLQPVQDWQVWVIDWFGGSGNVTAMTDYDDGAYLESDLRQALKDRELIQEDGMVLIQADEYLKQPVACESFEKAKDLATRLQSKGLAAWISYDYDIPAWTVGVGRDENEEPEDAGTYDEEDEAEETEGMQKLDWDKIFESLKELADKADTIADYIEDSDEYHDKSDEKYGLALVMAHDLKGIMKKAAEMADEVSEILDAKKEAC